MSSSEQPEHRGTAESHESTRDAQASPPAAPRPPGATGELSDELREHLRARRRPGDRWVETRKGRFWGLYGAAGLLLHDPDRGVLLQHRVEWSAHGGTWGIPGGAIDEGETPLTGAVRECHEEAGVPRLDGEDIRIVHTHVVDMEGWSYTTVVARTLTRMEAYVADIESLELRWVPLDEVTDYSLHPGFAAAWPQLRTVLEQEA